MNEAYQRLSEEVGWGSAKAGADEVKLQLLDNYVVGDPVLDVGCATGVYTDYLAKSGKQAFGMDINPRLLKIAKERSRLANFFQGDILDTELQPKSFDTVVAFDILEHVDEDLALTNMIQLARKRIILTVPHSTHPALKKLFLLYGHHVDPTHRRTYTPVSAQDMLARHHLSPVNIQPLHPLSTDGIFLALFDGSKWQRRLARKLSFTLVKPRQFFTNLCIVADVN